MTHLPVSDTQQCTVLLYEAYCNALKVEINKTREPYWLSFKNLFKDLFNELNLLSERLRPDLHKEIAGLKKQLSEIQFSYAKQCTTGLSMRIQTYFLSYLGSFQPGQSVLFSAHPPSVFLDIETITHNIDAFYMERTLLSESFPVLKGELGNILALLNDSTAVFNHHIYPRTLQLGTRQESHFSFHRISLVSLSSKQIERRSKALRLCQIEDLVCQIEDFEQTIKASCNYNFLNYLEEIDNFRLQVAKKRTFMETGDYVKELQEKFTRVEKSLYIRSIELLTKEMNEIDEQFGDLFNKNIVGRSLHKIKMKIDQLKRDCPECQKEAVSLLLKRHQKIKKRIFYAKREWHILLGQREGVPSIPNVHSKEAVCGFVPPPSLPRKVVLAIAASIKFSPSMSGSYPTVSTVPSVQVEDPRYRFINEVNRIIERLGLLLTKPDKQMSMGMTEGVFALRVNFVMNQHTCTVCQRVYFHAELVNPKKTREAEYVRYGIERTRKELVCAAALEANVCNTKSGRIKDKIEIYLRGMELWEEYEQRRVYHLKHLTAPWVVEQAILDVLASLRIEWKYRF